MCTYLEEYSWRVGREAALKHGSPNKHPSSCVLRRPTRKDNHMAGRGIISRVWAHSLLALLPVSNVREFLQSPNHPNYRIA